MPLQMTRVNLGRLNPSLFLHLIFLSLLGCYIKISSWLWRPTLDSVTEVSEIREKNKVRQAVETQIVFPLDMAT